MNVVVWGINYTPEMTGIAPFNTALCEYLAEHGCRVEMVTGFAYYPEWKKRSEDRNRLYRTDRTKGVGIHRCWVYVPHRVSALRRMVHEGSFVLTSLIRVLVLKKPSVFVVVSPPLLLGMAAWIASVLKRTPFVFHVQDLQPDAAVGLGMLQKGWLTRVLYWIEGHVYSKAVKVSGISDGMLQMFRKKGVAEEKLIFFPNGVRLPAVLPSRGMFRARNQISEKAFIAVYSGNLGIKQGLDVLIDAAKELMDRGEAGKLGETYGREIIIVIAGDGAKRAVLAGRIAESAIGNVLLLPLQSEIEYREMLADIDCSVITQQTGTGSFFFPSKLLPAVAAAKPVLTVADENSELAKAVLTGNFGINVPPGRPDLLANALIEICGIGSGECCLSASDQRMAVAEHPTRQKRDTAESRSYSRMGLAGLKFAEQFEMNRVLGSFFKQLEAVVDSTAVCAVEKKQRSDG